MLEVRAHLGVHDTGGGGGGGLPSASRMHWPLGKAAVFGGRKKGKTVGAVCCLSQSPEHRRVETVVSPSGWLAARWAYWSAEAAGSGLGGGRGGLSRGRAGPGPSLPRDVAEVVRAVSPASRPSKDRSLMLGMRLMLKLWLPLGMRLMLKLPRIGRMLPCAVAGSRSRVGLGGGGQQPSA